MPFGGAASGNRPGHHTCPTGCRMSSSLGPSVAEPGSGFQGPSPQHHRGLSLCLPALPLKGQGAATLPPLAVLEKPTCSGGCQVFSLSWG